MNTEIYGFIKQKNGDLVTVTITEPSGQPHTISSTSASFKDVMDLWKQGLKKEAVDAISAAMTIKSYTCNEFTVEGNQLLVKGQPVPQELADNILDFKADGLDYMPLVKFAENLLENPSRHSVQQLFGFLTKNKQPITEDGHFIAYKRVGADFKDLYSKTFDNSPGKIVEMPRNQVADDPTVTCSHGLHAANWDYACNVYCAGQGVLVSVKVNPRDCVSVPTDHNESKLRVSRYEVLQIVQEPTKEKLVSDTGGTYCKPSDPIISDDEPELDDEDTCLDCDYEYEDCMCDEEDRCEDCDNFPEDCTCGKQQAGATSAQMTGVRNFCSYCGKATVPSANFCANCGTKFVD